MVRLPRDVENSFEEVHIQKIWNILEEKFSFNVKGWKEDFGKYLDKSIADKYPNDRLSLSLV